MRSLTNFLVAALAVASFANAKGKKPCTSGSDKCPTVISTTDVCSTCIRPLCISISTISNGPGCPPKVPTITTSYPCSSNTCPGGCAGTSYVYASTYTDSGAGTYPTVTRTQQACPTITSVTGRCSTCVMPQCEALSTIYSQCGCPAAVPTVYTEYVCEDGCQGGCAGTEYIFATDTTICDTMEPTGTAPCVPTVTVTEHPGASEGCEFECSDDFCITDKFVTLPCGCTSADSVVTVTDTACATKSPCWNCHTGFPFTTTAEDCAEPTY